MDGAMIFFFIGPTGKRYHNRTRAKRRIHEMNAEEFKAARDFINSRPLNDFIPLEASPKAGAGMYCCPICGSGKGPHKTGTLHLYRNYSGQYITYCAKGCFTNEKGGTGQNTFNSIISITNESPGEVARKYGGEGFSLYRPQTAARTNDTPRQKPKKPQEDYTERYRQWHDCLIKSPQAMKYLQGRGLSLETIEYFNLGYDPLYFHPSNPNERVPRVIIPYGPYFYRTRRIDGKDESKKYLPCGTGPKILNSAAMNEGAPVWVVEGDVDCMIVWQTLYKHVVSIGGTGGKLAFLEMAKEHRDLIYILGLDNDEAGKSTQDSLYRMLDVEHIRAISTDTGRLYGKYKDAGEAANDAEYTAIFQAYTQLAMDASERK